MNTTKFLAPILLIALASGGGGGISASAASGLLLDQWADCNAAYRELSRPFTDAAQCKPAPG